MAQAAFGELKLRFSALSSWHLWDFQPHGPHGGLMLPTLLA